MKKVFSITLILVLGLVIIITDSSQSEVIEEKLDQMTLEEKIGQMLMPDLRMWQEENTTAMNEGTAQMIRDYHLGGVILFEKNIVNKEQLVKLTDQLQAEAGDVPLLISIDQEGGRVKRIPGGTNMPGNMALGAAGSEELAYRVGKALGSELKSLGINLNFAPVLDVNINPANPVIGVRSFSADPELVSRLGLQYMRGLQEQGVAATAKHFPGHGDTDVDSHLGLPMLPHDQERLEAVELRPFREAVSNGVDMIMTAHVTFPAIDDTRAISKKDGAEITIPATLSYRVLTELLREEISFEGVIVTDAFTMKAITDHFGEGEAVVRAVKAGADIILMPLDVGVAFHAILEAVESGEISEERIDQSVRRILDLKDKYGILTGDDEDLTDKIRRVQQVVGNSEHRALEKEVSEKAVTLVKNEREILPFRLDNEQRILLLAPSEEDLELMQEALSQASGEGEFELELSSAVYISPEILENISPETLSGADYIILGTRNLEEKVGTDFGKDKMVVVLAMENPYDLMYLPDIKAYVAVYGAERPNLLAGMKAIFGEIEPQGKLSVTIPEL